MYSPCLVSVVHLAYLILFWFICYRNLQQTRKKQILIAVMTSIVVDVSIAITCEQALCPLAAAHRSRPK